MIIVSDAKTEALRQMLCDTITTCISGASNSIEIIVVEKQDTSYLNATKVNHPDGPFNYNKCLNEGARYAKGRYLLFCNNDLVFTPGWDEALVSQMNAHECEAGSPWCPMVKEYGKRNAEVGYHPRRLFAGWCFMLTRAAYDRIGGLSEEYSYWCSDNVVCDQLEEADIKHILVREAIVVHIGDQTGKTIDSEPFLNMTWKQARKYEKKTGKVLFSKAAYQKAGI